MWNIQHKYCKNDDAITINGEKYGDVNKDYPDDPTLSFGLIGNYKCYQVN